MQRSKKNRIRREKMNAAMERFDKWLKELDEHIARLTAAQPLPEAPKEGE